MNKLDDLVIGMVMERNEVRYILDVRTEFNILPQVSGNSLNFI